MFIATQPKATERHLLNEIRSVAKY